MLLAVNPFEAKKKRKGGGGGGPRGARLIMSSKPRASCAKYLACGVNGSRLSIPYR